MKQIAALAGNVNEIKQVPGTSLIVARSNYNYWLINLTKPEVRFPFTATEKSTRNLPLKIIFPEPILADGALQVLVEDSTFIKRYEISTEGMKFLLLCEE